MRTGVTVMAVLLLLYVFFVVRRALALLTTGLGQEGPAQGSAVAVAMGVAMLVLPPIAVWGVGREIAFGWRAERLARRLENEGGLPDDIVTLSPSGRVGRADGDAVFPKYRAQVEQDETDWRAWYRLGLAYDAAGDRRRARGAVREAIKRERAAVR
jgi:hypothetical protein